MKRLLYILLLLVGGFSLIGQPISHNGSIVSHQDQKVSVGAELYPSVLDDGNTEAWFIADVSNYTTIGDSAVSVWQDRSGNDNDLLQSNVDLQPLYNDDTLYFNGLSSSIGTYMYDTIVGLEQPVTIYMVFRQRSYTSSSRIYDGATSNSGTLMQYADSPELAIRSATILYLVDELAVGDFGIVTSIYNGTSSSVQLNDGTAATGDAGVLDMGGFMLGGDYNGPGVAAITVKEIIIRSVSDGATDKSDIIDYLNTQHTVY